MINTLSKFLIILVASLAAIGSQAQLFEHREFAAEITQTNFGSSLTQGGVFYVKRCDQCATEGVSFGPSTRFYQKSSAISKETAKSLDGQGATVFYDPKSKYVTRVVFWR